MASARAIRPEVDGRYDEILEYVDSTEGAIATCTNLPRGDVLGGVVVCSSLYNEFLKNYRREVMLARALAMRGIAVQRLHYRGTGHSDGTPTDTTLDTMQQDVQVAAGRLAELAGTDNVAYVGTRVGGLVAAGASASRGAPLALLEPVADADRFFREGLRTILFAGVVRKRTAPDGAGPTTVDDLVQELNASGLIDVLGYTIGLRLFEGARGVTLLDLMGPGSRPVMVVQLGSGDLRPDLQRAVEGMVDRGCAVTTELAGAREAWWFAEEEEEAPGQLENRSHGLAVTDPVVESIGTWLARHLGLEGDA